MTKQSILRFFRSGEGWIATSPAAPRNDRRRSGNAVIFILLAVALFGALAYTFMRGAKTGQGNLSAGQAKLKAQELATFLDNVEKGINKLRQRGCSQSDISFAYTGSLSGDSFLDGQNQPATAPVDHSCDVFNAAGGNVSMNVTISDYQIPLAGIGGGQGHLYNHPWYKKTIETRTTPISFWSTVISIYFIKPEICEAYNKILNNGVDISILETGATGYGFTNTTLMDKSNYCYYRAGTDQNGGPVAEIVYAWIRY